MQVLGQFVRHHGFYFSTKAEGIFSKIENTRNLLQKSSQGYKINDHSLTSLFHELNKIEILNKRDEGSLLKHDHLDNLDSYVEQLIKDGCKVEAKLLFQLFQESENSRFYFYFPTLVKYMDPNELEKKDDYGWSLIHWAVFLKQPMLVQELKQRGLNRYAKDYNGITPVDLAVFILSRETLQRLYLHGNLDDKFSEIKPSFHGEMIGKLRSMKVFNRGCYYGLLERAIPNPSHLNNRDRAEIDFKKLYNPFVLEKNEKVSPMGLAVREKKLERVGELLDQGWSDLVEAYVVRKRWCEDQEKTANWHSELHRIEENAANKDFFVDLTVELMNRTRVRIDKMTTETVADKLKNWGQLQRFAYRNYE